jgi:hypothetical protein
MRRNAKSVFRLRTTLFTIFATFLSLASVEAAPKKPSVIVKVSDVSHVDRLTRKYNWRVVKTIPRGTAAVFVIDDVSEGQIKQLLKNEAGVLLIEDNKALPLDGGETVLPLDGGETVLPLDGGETVLPLGSDQDWSITQLLDGGETVLPLDELKMIRSSYAAIVSNVAPSKRVILQPAFRKIGLYPAIARATGRGVVIADLDTGGDTCHPMLKGIVTYTFVDGADANAPENCPTSATQTVPGYGHGTRVASLMRVMAPEARLWAVRVFDNSGSAQTSTIYEAIIFAADHGVNVINMSFGTATPSAMLDDAINYARSLGVTLVAAAGNSNVEPMLYPAQSTGVKGIVAVTNGDIKTSFSSYGSAAFISAPGYGLWTAHPNSQIAYVAGTSYASPLAAAEAALIIDSYQRTYNGSPTSSFVTSAMSVGTQNVDSLNSQYTGKLGQGRIYIPWALSVTPSATN